MVPQPRRHKECFHQCFTELCAEIIKALHVRTEAKDWESFEVKNRRQS